MKVSEHFYLHEFASHDGALTPAHAVANIERLCGLLEKIRARIARPVAIISGYRSAAQNQRVGGARASTHLDGSGADIRAGDPDDLHATILTMWKDGELPELGGLGRYTGWVHVDLRKSADGHLRRWAGSGTGSEPGG